MAWGKMRTPKHLAKLTALLSLLLATALLTAPSCGPPKATPPPPIKTPSKVITESGVEFYVWRLKLPGSSQELRLKQAGSTTWVPLSIISYITFTAPEADRYKPAIIVLTSGERVQGDLFVDHLIEGITDVGYWNIPFKDVRQMSLGEE